MPPGNLPRNSHLAWEHLGIPLEELEEVGREREVRASLIKLLPQRPDLEKAENNG